jgi:hypothetical protein
MNTSHLTPSPFEQSRADAWRKRRDLHHLRQLIDADNARRDAELERWLNEEIEVSPKDFALTIAFGGLVCFVGAGFWYGVFGLLRWLAHAFLF